MDYPKMIRFIPLVTAFLSASMIYPVCAQNQRDGAALVEMFDKWGTYATRSGKKICYAMSKPTERKPDNLNRDPGYVFVSSRPSDSISEEVVFVVGFPIKKDSEATLQIGTEKFQMFTDGSSVWARSPEEQTRIVAAMRKGSSLSISAISMRGNKSTDSYSLAGVTKALNRAKQECR